MQREIESRGIRTASIMHLPKVASKARPPRMLHIDFPLGLTFGHAGDWDSHRELLKELLDFAVDGGAEEVRKSHYHLEW